MIYTVKSLLSDLSAELPLVNDEQYRRQVMRVMRETLRNIGYKYTAIESIDKFEIDNHQIQQLPDHVLDVLDAGFHPDRMEAYHFERRVHASGHLYFTHTPFGIEFPNFACGELYLAIQALPLIGTDYAIHEEAYEAVYKSVFATLLPQFPLHPRFGDRMIEKAEARNKVGLARAWFNQRGLRAQNRTINRFN